jgi:hypothetical protein
MVGGPVFQSRRGQNRMRNGKTVCHRNVSDSCRRVSAPPSRPFTARIISRKNEKGGRDESKLRNPSAQRGGIRHAIRIFDRGSGSFPGVTFQEIPSQCLAAGDQAVVAIGRRERRQEGERLLTPIAIAAADRNPVMIFVVGLFTTTAMTDDRVAQANRTLAQDWSSTSLDPIGFQIALRRRK